MDLVAYMPDQLLLASQMFSMAKSRRPVRVVSFLGWQWSAIGVAAASVRYARSDLRRATGGSTYIHRVVGPVLP